MTLKIENDNGIIELCEKVLFAEAGNSYDAKPVDLSGFTPQQIAQLVHELSALAWISVEDELPKEAGWYQAKGINGYTMYYFDGSEFDFTETHWQPLAKVGK